MLNIHAERMGCVNVLAQQTLNGKQITHYAERGVEGTFELGIHESLCHG
jgi:hypothetical protein